MQQRDAKTGKFIKKWNEQGQLIERNIYSDKIQTQREKDEEKEHNDRLKKINVVYEELTETEPKPRKSWITKLTVIILAILEGWRLVKGL